MATSSDKGCHTAPSSVLVYSHSWLPAQVDGVAVRMMGHVAELVERGSKVTVVTPDFIDPRVERSKDVDLAKIPGVVEHITLRSQFTPVYRKNLCLEITWSNFWALVRAIQKFKPDVVHGTQEASMQVLCAACAWCNVPLVISFHTDVRQIADRDQGFSTLGGVVGKLHSTLAVWFTEMGYKNWARSGAYYFPVSHQSSKILADVGVSKEQVASVLWGPMVDRKLFQVDMPKDTIDAMREKLTFGIDGAFLLVYAGRVTAEKDVQFLVDALDRAPKNVVLALVGGGSAASEFSKLHGKENRLHCIGAMVSREEVALSFRAADAAVSASTMETIGFTAMEALSCGTPMLAVRAQGFALHLTHGVNARLWSPLDAASFDEELKIMMATKLEGNWSREQLRQSMAHASVQDCTDRCVDVYLQAGHRRLVQFIAALFWMSIQIIVNFMMK